MLKPSSSPKFKQLKKKLYYHRKRSKASFVAKHKKAAQWLAKRNLGLTPAKTSARLLTSASLFGTLLLSSGEPHAKLLTPKTIEAQVETGLVAGEAVNSLLKQKLSQLLTEQPIGQLNPQLEEKVCAIIEEVLGCNVCFDLEGISLNHFYGWMGYEQHLKRFPGDTLSGHDEEIIAGIAPGLGAWGYFASSQEAMTEEIVLREKYYVAVQTLYLPEWSQNTKELYEWFKYRKVLVVNPETGQAVVGVVGDAGPADWTGKQFGGSPELMKALSLHQGSRKGKVLLFFFTDSDDQVPLGPLDYNIAKGRLQEI